MTVISRFFLFATIVCLSSLMSACGNVKPVTESSIWTLELKKGGCLDACKSYHINIHSSGTYVYKGNYNVPLGEKIGTLKQEQMLQLNEILDAIKWVDLEPTYGNNAVDSQRKELEYASKSTVNKIVYYRLEPIEIRTLEQFIDTLIEQDDF
jgi:Domain of unknown function (DUF6438)